MKTIFSLLAISLWAYNGTAQDTTHVLDFNNVSALVTNKGHFFNDEVNAVSGYEIPKGSGLSTIYTSAFWYASVNASGEIATCLGGYGNSSDVDRGPFSSTNEYADPSYDKAFMISICQSEIEEFNLWWECTNGITTIGCSGSTTPSSETLNSIYNWPGNGNTTLGQSAQLAPYFDRNGDGIYDPIGSGDYPIIKGCCATYLIQNDAGKVHTYSGTDPIGIEMHYLIYQYGANDLLYNTTFVDVMAINKGNTNYPSFSQGYYVDGDLGNPFDDYYGYSAAHDMMFFYNGDNVDENDYGVDPPAFGIVALESPVTSAVPYYSNGQNFVPTIVNHMNGLQFDGSPWVDPNNNITAFPYDGDPNDLSQWSQLSGGQISGDLRAVMSTSSGPFNAGDTIKQSYALVFARSGNNLENVSELYSLASDVKTFYDSGQADDGCDAGGFLSTPEMEVSELLIYPNPSNGVFRIEGVHGTLRSIRIVDLAGKHVNFQQEGTDSMLEISLQNAKRGVYLLNIETETGTVVKRVVVE